MRSLAAAKAPADRVAIEGVIAKLYRPWLDHHARMFQNAVVAAPDSYAVPEPWQREAGTCIVFIDGLRLDIGHRLSEVLRSRGYTVAVNPHLAALPTITASAKPALAPKGIELLPGPGLEPTTNGSTKVTAAVLPRPPQCHWLPNPCGRRSWRYDEARLDRDRIDRQ